MNILEQKPLTIKNSKSRIAFEYTGGGSWPEWYRHLCIDGEKLMQIGNICSSCPFFFEKMGLRPRICPEILSDQLNQGLHKLDPEVVDALSLLMPNGNYHVILSEVTPELCHPGDPNDYFAHEQKEDFGLPMTPIHDPKGDYYRLSSTLDDKEDELFCEFLVPFSNPSILDQKRLSGYQKHLEAGEKPTLVTIGVFDIKASEDVADAPWHLCLAHYLLDGHHKSYAAAQTERPLTMLSFIALDQGIPEHYSSERIKKLLAT